MIKVMQEKAQVFLLLKAYYTIWLSRPSVCFVRFGLKFSYIFISEEYIIFHTFVLGRVRTQGCNL